MGVYIAGMEMPKNCMLCPLCVEEADPANGEMCMVTGTLMPPCTRERLDSCPLVSVPPRGRLGDLDALIEKVIAKYLEHERKGELVFAAAEIKQDIVDLISNAPTIIPAEEGET